MVARSHAPPDPMSAPAASYFDRLSRILLPRRRTPLLVPPLPRAYAGARARRRQQRGRPWAGAGHIRKQRQRQWQRARWGCGQQRRGCHRAGPTERSCRGGAVRADGAARRVRALPGASCQFQVRAHALTFGRGGCMFRLQVQYNAMILDLTDCQNTYRNTCSDFAAGKFPAPNGAGCQPLACCQAKLRPLVDCAKLWPMVRCAQL